MTLDMIQVLPGDTLLGRYVHGVSDQPGLGLEDLTPAERGKLFFRFVSAVHADPYAQQISEAAGIADYYIKESVINVPSVDRPILDVADNMLLYGRQIPYSIPLSADTDDGPVDVILNGQLDTTVHEGVFSTVCRDLIDPQMPEPSIIRSMDMSYEDILPGTFMTLREAYRMERESFESAGLLTDTNENIIATLDNHISLWGVTMYARNYKQYRDISTITANAVRRHPEKDRIVVAVLQGMAHDAVAKKVLALPDIEGEHLYVPGNDGQAEIPHESLRHRAHDELITTGTLSQDMRQRLLLFNYLSLAVISAGGDVQRSTKIFHDAEVAVSVLCEEHVTSLLESAENVKRRKSVMRLLSPVRYLLQMGDRIASQAASEIKALSML